MACQRRRKDREKQAEIDLQRRQEQERRDQERREHAQRVEEESRVEQTLYEREHKYQIFALLPNGHQVTADPVNQGGKFQAVSGGYLYASASGHYFVFTRQQIERAEAGDRTQVPIRHSTPDQVALYRGRF